VNVPQGWYVCQNLSEVQPASASANTFVQLVTGGGSISDPTAPGGTASTTYAGNGSLFLGNTSVTPAGRTKGGVGLCQDVVVPTSGQLTFYVYEGTGGTSAATSGNAFVSTIPSSGTTFPTGSAQEAAILDPTSHTYKAAGSSTGKLFLELDGTQSNATPSSSNTVIGESTGGFVQRGPYDLSAYAGSTVTLYFGIWGSSAATTAFTFMYVDNVTLTGTVQSMSVRRLPARR
jgi:hypothetical protein